MTLNKNDETELYIDGFTSEGSGVGHIDGFAVFVSGTAPGDTVLAHIIKVKKAMRSARRLKYLKSQRRGSSRTVRLFPPAAAVLSGTSTMKPSLKLKSKRLRTP